MKISRERLQQEAASTGFKMEHLEKNLVQECQKAFQHFLPLKDNEHLFYINY
ncbi:hypothetical protein Ltuc_1254 [Legionella tucsonensis]|uniref:Uncharacterized protein n=1 Tax=Legionella tucsonensis TaxID=40335 RepID=A0A0W0ZW64_9GAMM|nr:hypothetical protein Ltuc_1254 [Legionella tucsonensis]